MALPNICATLKSGADLSCLRPNGKFYQQLVLINYSDIDQSTIVAPWTEGYNPTDECQYFAQFVLNEGATGYMFQFPERSTGVSVTTDISTTDLGYPTFIHNMNMLAPSSTEEDKCRLDAIAKTRLVAVGQLLNGEVEVVGLEYGLYLADVTIDSQSNGGITPIILSSIEGGEESFLPLVYKPQDGGDAVADFDSAFANTTP